MPLPPALAARLAKRGILQKSLDEQGQEPTQQEEVFVEHYDDEAKTAEEDKENTPAEPVHRETEEKGVESDEDEEDDELVYELIACPNKFNPYHECLDFCTKRWGVKEFAHKTQLLPNVSRLLRKHPLPSTWVQVGDPETGRYYYWNTQSEEVSWLPPSHPKANISLSAAALKKLLKDAEGSRLSSDSESDSDHDVDMKENGEDAEEDEEEEDHIMDMDDFEEMERQVLRDKERQEREERKHREDDKKGGRKGRKKQENLDPMDPASYSDIPRGTWSTGLEMKGSAKTGVDASASGPLFQQRPYPSPGAVLRMNKGESD